MGEFTLIKIKIMKTIWNWLNGKKTAIGAVVSLITAYLIAKGWIGEAEQDLLLGFSTLLVGGGLAHKITKAISNE